MLDWWGPIIHEYYSGTEDIGTAAITPQEWLAHPGSVGRPMDECHIVGEDGQEVPSGQAGVGYFARRPLVGYHNDPGQTAAVTHQKGSPTPGGIRRLDAAGYL